MNSMLVFTALCLGLLCVAYAEDAEKCTWTDCYTVHKELINYNDAWSACDGAEGATLADINSEAENNLVKNFLKDSNITKGVWTSYHQHLYSPEWRNSEGAVASSAFFDFADPSAATTAFDYPIGVILDPSHDFQWSVAAAGDLNYVLCMRKYSIFG